MAITLVCKGIVDSGSEFYYMGPLDECEGCKLNGVCNNLEAGARYRIIDVRKQEHDCPGMDDDGKVVAVEVEKISARLFNAVQMVTKYGYSVIRQMMITTRYKNIRDTIFLFDFVCSISVISFL